jgi:hypothetical protein
LSGVSYQVSGLLGSDYQKIFIAAYWKKTLLSFCQMPKKHKAKIFLTTVYIFISVGKMNRSKVSTGGLC